MVQCLR